MKLGPFQNKDERERAIVDFVTHVVRSSEEQTSPDRARWKENEELIVGRMDWGQDLEGQEWQSRVFLHEYAPIIRRVAAAIQGMIIEQGSELFNFIAYNDSSAEMARIREKINRYYLDEIKFHEKFYEYLMAGCIYGFACWKLTIDRRVVYKPDVIIDQISKMQTKELSGIKAENAPRPIILPDSVEEIEMGLEEALKNVLGAREGEYIRPEVGSKKVIQTGMQLKLINPHNLFTHPDIDDLNESPYIAERGYSKLFQLSPLFESNFLNKKYLDVLRGERSSGTSTAATAYGSYESLKLRQRDQYNKQSAYMPNIEWIEYFGPFLSKEGDIIEEHAHFVVGNGKYCLRDAINPYWNKKPPYHFSVFGRIPFRPYAVGVADNAVPNQKLINELMSIYVDDVKYDTYAPVIANVDKVVDEDQLHTGIRPGEVVGIYGDGKASDVISGFPQRSNVGPALFQTIEKLSLSGQKGSSVSTMSSNPASRARISAQEIESNDSQRAESENTIGVEIDNNCIERIVQAIDSLSLQFGFTNENLELLASKGILTESEYMYIANMTDVERFQEASNSYEVEIRGYRAIIDRKKKLRLTGEMLTTINQTPPQAQERIQWDNLIQDVVEEYGFDPDRIIRAATPQDKAREENFILKNNQMLGCGQNDVDAAELLVHYEGIMQSGPLPSLIAHVQEHMQRIMMQGGQIPPPPPEVAQVMGIMVPEGMNGMNQLTQGGKPAPKQLMAPANRTIQ